MCFKENALETAYCYPLMRMYYRAQTYKDDEYQLTQLLLLRNPLCLLFVELEEFSTSHTGARFCSHPLEFFSVSNTYM